MVKWIKPVSEKKKKKVEEFIENIEKEIKNETFDFPEPIGRGQFADCYKVDGLIIKRTHYFFLEEYYNEHLEVELCFSVDHNILKELPDSPYLPTLYGYTDGKLDSYTIMEDAGEAHLENFLLKGNKLTNHLENKIISGLEWIIEEGYLPFDMQMDDIRFKDERVIFIDQNLYQSMDTLRLDGAKLDFSKSNKELATEYWNNLIKWGLIWVNEQKKYA